MSGDNEPDKRSLLDLGGAGLSGWLLIGFFVLLLAINATFFAVAFDNPPQMSPTSDTAQEQAPGHGNGD